MNPRPEELRLKDILTAIDTIYDVRKLLITYPNENLLHNISRDAINFNLIVIGEAIRKLPDPFKITNSHIAWQEAIDLRNHLAHQYFAIDVQMVETIIEGQLREMAELIEELIN